MDRHKLLDIAGKESFLLYDTSLDHADNGFQFTMEIFPLKTFKQLDYEHLFATLEDTIAFLELVQNEKTYTIEEVAHELSKLQEHYSKKLAEFNRSKKNWVKFKYNGRNYNGRNGGMHLCEKEKLFDELCWNVKEAVRISKQSIYKPRDNAYECLTSVLCLLAKELRIEDLPKEMNRYSPWYEYRAGRKKKENLSTDEKLISAAFYKSIFEQSDAALVTRDGRFVRLLIYFAKLLSSYDIYHEKVFREGLKNHPVKLYTPQKDKRGDFGLAISTSDVRTPFYYRLPNHSGNDDKLFKEKVNNCIISLEEACGSCV